VLFLLLISGHLFAREVAITFDDLPRGGDSEGSTEADRAMTIKLLAPFQRDHIPVSGFVNECNRPDELRAILGLWIAAGADLGNHTCPHPDLNKTRVADFEYQITRGEVVTTELLGQRPQYFRYPFLHTGDTPEVKGAVQKFVATRGYKNAPVTLDNNDYLFAAYYAKTLTSHNIPQAEHIRKEYVSYMESIFEFFEKRSVEVTGHEIRQILLLHANQLNADAISELMAMMRQRGYKMVSLTRALDDPAYSLPDTYVGTRGLSWIHRWSITKHMKPKKEPDEPEWIRKGPGD
jgi:peptidoglycan/xylan/chitin deacetylase (PgdA/CDA1 family)